MAPANLSSNTTGPDTIFVFWLPVSGSSINGILQGYNVYVRRLGAMQSENVTVVRNGTTVLLYHLEIFTTYEISVAAFTEAGDGPSASVIKKTGEGGKKVFCRAPQTHAPWFSGQHLSVAITYGS